MMEETSLRSLTKADVCRLLKDGTVECANFSKDAEQPKGAVSGSFYLCVCSSEKIKNAARRLATEVAIQCDDDAGILLLRMHKAGYVHVKAENAYNVALALDVCLRVDGTFEKQRFLVLFNAYMLWSLTQEAAGVLGQSLQASAVGT